MAFDDRMFYMHQRPWEHQSQAAEGVWHQSPAWSYSFQIPGVDDHQASMQRFLRGPDEPWSGVKLPSPTELYTRPEQHISQLPQPVLNQQAPYRFSSPSNSGFSSNDTGSWADQQSTPFSSPCPSAAEFPSYVDSNGFAFGGGELVQPRAHLPHAACVAMHDVQFEADRSPEQLAYDDSMFATVAEEGYQPKEVTMDDCNDSVIVDSSSESPQLTRPESPNVKRRRAQLPRSNTSPVLSSRVAKKSTTSRRRSSAGTKPSNRRNSVVDTQPSNRAFPCVLAMYGCEASFGSKNEWKRHVFTQHMRIGYWRCDLCDRTNRGPNDFNRKDLFIQHVRRMHSNEHDDTESKNDRPGRSRKEADDPRLATIADRCYNKVRCLPFESRCHFCDDRFEGQSSWEERMEHIGSVHMEATKKAQKELEHHDDWEHDESLHNYLVHEQIIEKTSKGQWALTDAQK